MRIAITAEGPSSGSNLCPRFGRAPHLLVYDTESQTYQHIDNTANAELAQAAGIQTAQAVAEAGVEVGITGQTGPKASDALQAAGVQVAPREGGQVDQLVQEFLAGGSGAPPAQPAGQSPAQGAGQGMGQGAGRGMGGGGGGRCGGGQGRGMGGGGRGMGGRGMGGGNPGRGRGTGEG